MTLQWPQCHYVVNSCVWRKIWLSLRSEGSSCLANLFWVLRPHLSVLVRSVCDYPVSLIPWYRRLPAHVERLGLAWSKCLTVPSDCWHPSQRSKACVGLFPFLTPPLSIVSLGWLQALWMLSHRFRLVLDCSSHESDCFLCNSRLECDQSSKLCFWEELGGAHKEALHLSFLPNCVENGQALITY